MDKEDEYVSKPLRCDYCCGGKEEGVMRGDCTLDWVVQEILTNLTKRTDKGDSVLCVSGAAKESVCLLYSLIGRGHRKK